VTLEDAIHAVQKVEIIDKESELIIRRMNDPISAFIPLHYQSLGMAPTHPTMPRMDPVPLSSQEPMMLSAAPVDQFRLEMRQVSSEVTRAVQELTNQMTCLLKEQSHQALPRYHESGMYSTGVWCNQYGQPNHTPPFCQLPHDKLPQE